MGIMKIIIKG